MFGVQGFMLNLFLIWTFISLALAESTRHKKDVHHMIILKGGRSSSKRHKNHSMEKSNRRPIRENASGSSEEDEIIKHKAKKKRNKNRSKPKNHSSFSSSYSESEWIPMTSKEAFDGDQYHQTFPGRYQTGTIRFSQPEHIELTTPLALPSNILVENILYPPLRPVYQGMNTWDYYKTEKPPKEILMDDHHAAESVATPFSIIADGTTEGAEKREKKRNKRTRSKGKRGRGTSRFGDKIKKSST